MRSTARLLRFTSSFASLLFAGACAPELAPSPAPSTGTPGLVGLPGENDGATRRYLASLHFDGTRSRWPVTCHGGQSVDIEISPERNSHQVDPVEAASAGRIVAMIKNVGNAACPELGLAPGDSAYWWMGGDMRLRGKSKHALTVVFWSIPSHGPIRPLTRTADVIWHHDGQRPTARAAISEHLVHPVGSDDGDEETLRFGHNSTWIACLGGCCESTGVEAFYTS